MNRLVITRTLLIQFCKVSLILETALNTSIWTTFLIFRIVSISFFKPYERLYQSVASKQVLLGFDEPS